MTYLSDARRRWLRPGTARPRMLLLLLGGTLALSACQSAYYGTMEAFGVHKRDILVDRVDDVREEQVAAREEFRDALEAFRAVADFEGGELETQYRRFASQLDQAQGQAEDVWSEIEDVAAVSAALFEEWEKELDEYESAELRDRSAAQLAQTRLRYNDLHLTLTRAADAMTPVLGMLNDQVLFLKHNLNAQAISSLDDDVALLTDEIETLIEQLELAITEADAFIDSMESPES